MSTSLVVSSRHLSLPEACLFAPTELSLPAQTTQSEYQKIGAGLSKIDQANDLWLADYAAFGLKWENGLELASAATGRTEYYLKRVAKIAERFTPEKRFPAYAIDHYKQMMPFPASFTDTFLPEVAHLSLSGKALRIRAEEEYGSNPYKPKQPKKRSVYVRADLWVRLQAHAPAKKVSALVERVCESWLKQHPEAQKTTVPANPTVGNDIQSAQPHPETSAATNSPKPDYETRRKQQIADGAEKIPQKPEKKYSLRVRWMPCVRSEFMDSENGVNPLSSRLRPPRPTQFWSEELARAAEAEHFIACGYHEAVEYCAVHKCWHVAHRYSGEPQSKAFAEALASGAAEQSGSVSYDDLSRAACG
jgi:hypothetical protein